MTTIAVRGGVMASDSQCTDGGGMKTGSCQKIFRIEGRGVLGISGDADARDVVVLLSKSREMPSRERLAKLRIDHESIFLTKGGEIWIISISRDSGDDEWHGSCVLIEQEFAAVGSGAYFALGAMQFGASAEEAVVVAAAWDSNSGLPAVTALP